MKKKLLTTSLVLITAVLIFVLGGCQRDISSNPPINEPTAETTAEITAETTEKSPETEPPEKDPDERYSLSCEREYDDYFRNLYYIHGEDHVAGEKVRIGVRPSDLYYIYLLVNGERVNAYKTDPDCIWFEFAMPDCDSVLSIELEKIVTAKEKLSITISDEDNYYINENSFIYDADEICEKEYKPGDTVNVRFCSQYGYTGALHIHDAETSQTLKIIQPVLTDTRFAYFTFTMPAKDVRLVAYRTAINNLPSPLDGTFWKSINMPEEEWTNLVKDNSSLAITVYSAVTSLADGDSIGFARAMHVRPRIYSDIEGMKVGDFSVSYEDIPAKNDPTQTMKYPVLTLEVLESENEFFSPGHHKIVFNDGIINTFTRYEDFVWRTEYDRSEKRSPAELYVAHVHSDGSFESILEEGKRQGGLADFILFRLNTITNRENDYENGFTEDEIRAYAEKYLGVDGSTIKFGLGRTHVCPNGTHQLIGRGGSTYIHDFVSEEIRDGITVVTVNFYADASKTVISRTVEFHLKLIDVEYSPVKTVILKDSGFPTESYSI